MAANPIQAVAAGMWSRLDDATPLATLLATLRRVHAAAVVARHQHVNGPVQRCGGASQRLALRGHLPAGIGQAPAQSGRDAAGTCGMGEAVYRVGQCAVEFAGVGFDLLCIALAQCIPQRSQALLYRHQRVFEVAAGLGGCR